VGVGSIEDEYGLLAEYRIDLKYVAYGLSRQLSIHFVVIGTIRTVDTRLCVIPCNCPPGSGQREAVDVEIPHPPPPRLSFFHIFFLQLCIPQTVGIYFSL